MFMFKGELVRPGDVLMRQRGTPFCPGSNVSLLVKSTCNRIVLDTP